MKPLIQPLIARFRKVNWMLLLFLILFLNVKMLVKIAAILMLLILNRKMFSEKSIYRQRFIWFYWSMIIIGIINMLLNISSISTNHFIAILVGIFFWVMCIAAASLNYWFVLKTDPAKLHRTISLFFVLNIIVTAAQLLYIIWDTGSLNPYVYQGIYQKYFISTGDFLTGISFDVSNTNALINAFGVVYFLSRNKMKLTLLCMMVLLLTASNFTNILIIASLLFIFIFKSTRNQKVVILSCFLFLLIFMIKISPQNNRYVATAYKKIFHKKSEPVEIAHPAKAIDLASTVIKKKEGPSSPAILMLEPAEMMAQNSSVSFSSISLKENLPVSWKNIHMPFFQRRKEINPIQQKLLVFESQTLPSLDISRQQIIGRNLPGKAIAFQQTFHYLKNNPEKILFGNGIGSFSSKLAFRTTGLQIAGSYPQQFTYINKNFLSNHLNLYLAYFSRDMELHSVINSPDSTYDQLIAEYGLAGVLSFILFYIGFFVTRIRRLTYGIPLLLIMLGAFSVEYWFEQLSIVILFELLMLLNIKEMKYQYE